MAYKSEGRCWYCGGELDPYSGSDPGGVGGELEHLFRNIEEYESEWNKVVACKSCNQQKLQTNIGHGKSLNGNLDWDDYLIFLRRRDKNPGFIFFGMKFDWYINVLSEKTENVRKSKSHMNMSKIFKPISW